jgi:RNA polymerase sigma-70 factor (ECF subfamily)
MTLDEAPQFPEERDMLRQGGENALAEVFAQFRSKLERIVDFRLDPSLRARIDSSDVLQEAYIQIARRIGEFIDGSPVSLFVWVRQKTIQTLIDMQRTHFRGKRDVNRERHQPDQDYGQTSALSMARYLVDDVTSPSLAAARSEEMDRLQDALSGMNEIDREVLAMRHFEQLSNAEVAESLGLSPTAASNRYIRAVTKLGEIMKSIQEDRR